MAAAGAEHDGVEGVLGGEGRGGVYRVDEGAVGLGLAGDDVLVEVWGRGPGVGGRELGRRRGVGAGGWGAGGWAGGGGLVGATS